MLPEYLQVISLVKRSPRKSQDFTFFVSWKSSIVLGTKSVSAIL